MNEVSKLIYSFIVFLSGCALAYIGTTASDTIGFTLFLVGMSLVVIATTWAIEVRNDL